MEGRDVLLCFFVTKVTPSHRMPILRIIICFLSLYLLFIVGPSIPKIFFLGRAGWASYVSSWMHPFPFCWWLQAAELADWHNSPGDEIWGIPLGTAVPIAAMEPLKFQSELFSALWCSETTVGLYRRQGKVSSYIVTLAPKGHCIGYQYLHNQ